MSKKKTGLDNVKRQRISDRVLILTLFVQILILVNQSIGIYAVAAQSMQACIIEPEGEALEIHIETDTGRLNLVEKILRHASDWFSSYYVGGVEKTNATTGITINVTGSNVASTAYVDYYIEGVPQSGGSPYRFLEGNGTNITVGGSSLTPSNQTSIEDHLTAMGLSTDESHTIDYYVYVKAEATGAVSGETLTSEITYQKFDSVTYNYGTEVLETYAVESSVDDSYCVGNADFFMPSLQYVGFGDLMSSYYDYEVALRFTPDIPADQDLTSATLKMKQKQAFGAAFNAIIMGEDADNPNAPTSRSDLLGRTRTTASVTMTMGPWSDSTWHDSPDIQTVIEEIISRSGWSSGNAVILFLEDDEPGYYYTDCGINLWAYDSGAANAAKLECGYISYSASWYPLPPLSLADLPITLDVIALSALIAVTTYSLVSRKRSRNR